MKSLTADLEVEKYWNLTENWKYRSTKGIA